MRPHHVDAATVSANLAGRQSAPEPMQPVQRSAHGLHPRCVCLVATNTQAANGKRQTSRRSEAKCHSARMYCRFFKAPTAWQRLRQRLARVAWRYRHHIISGAPPQCSVADPARGTGAAAMGRMPEWSGGWWRPSAAPPSHHPPAARSGFGKLPRPAAINWHFSSHLCLAVSA